MAGGDADWRTSFREAGPYLSLGMQMGFTVAGFTLGGFFADRYLNTWPWLTIGGGAVGLIMLMVLLARTLRDVNAASSKRAGRK
jgi:F0F1-type ATP synthase assembly protein I